MTLSAKTLAVLKGGTQGKITFGDTDGCWRDINIGDHQQAARVVIRFEDDDPNNSAPERRRTEALEVNARKIALVNALADVAVKAAELKAAEEHLANVATVNDEVFSDEECRKASDRHTAAHDALDASLATLEAEASKHG